MHYIACYSFASHSVAECFLGVIVDEPFITPYGYSMHDYDSIKFVPKELYL